MAVQSAAVQKTHGDRLVSVRFCPGTTSRTVSHYPWDCMWTVYVYIQLSYSRSTYSVYTAHKQSIDIQCIYSPHTVNRDTGQTHRGVDHVRPVACSVDRAHPLAVEPVTVCAHLQRSRSCGMAERMRKTWCRDTCFLAQDPHRQTLNPKP